MKTKNTKRGPSRNSKPTVTCKATASGGSLVCALELGHGTGTASVRPVHSTAAPGKGKKPMQHATWVVGAGGQITVTTYSHGKRMSEWTEAGPVVEPVEAPSGFDCVEESDDPRPPWLREQTAKREATDREPSLIDACGKCGRELGEHDGKKCPKPTAKDRCEHVYSMISAVPDGIKADQLAERWFAEDSQVKHRPLTLDDEPQDEEDAPIETADEEPDDWEIQALARQQREAREAHANEVGDVEPEPEPEPEPVPSPIATSSPTTSTTVGETITCRGMVYPIHPAARIFPTPEHQYRALVESIRINGQKHHVELLDEPGNPVIDGCSRLRACEELGIEPQVKVISVVNPFRHVFAVNIDRRHMDESQRAMAAADLANMEHGANQHSRTGRSAGPPQITQAEAAQLAHASERLTRRAAQIKNSAVPEVAQAIREGKIKVDAGVELAKLTPAKQREILDKVTQGKGEVRPGKVRALVKQEEKREIIRSINTGHVAPMPTGPFGVIYGDYPWWYDNSDQHEGSRGHMEYPGMKMPAILAHAREAATRAGKDCVLALWFTNLYVREIGAVVDAYGATHHTMWTWPKPRAGVGTWGRGQTESLVIASIGNPVHTLNEVSTLLPAYALREPGRKPDEVAALLVKHCGGPFLEMFAREPREGWATWGAEAEGAKAIEIKPKSKILTATDRRMRGATAEGEGTRA